MTQPDAPMPNSGQQFPITQPSPPLDEGLRVTLPGQAGPQERWLWRGLLLVLCLLAYANSLSSEFLWDDNRHANASASMRTFDGLVNIWTKLGLEAGGTPQYYPLTHTVYWLEYQVWGKAAVGYRVFNILLHGGCALVLWELLRRLRVPGAFVAAGLFALHPVMAESVAWTTEQKNTLSLLLGLTSVLFYCKFAGITEDEAERVARAGAEEDWNLYTIALLAGVGALLSKTVAGAVPVWILLILWWQKKLSWRHVGLITPLLLAALCLGFVTGYTEHKHVIRPTDGSVMPDFVGYLSAKLTGTLTSGPEFEVPMIQRLLLAGVVPFFYASKLLVPVGLVFFYPRWDLAAAPGYWWAAHAVIAMLVVGGAVLAFRGTRWPLMILLGYLVALFPAMGFFDVYPFRYSFVADHFGYHASWILIATVAAGFGLLGERLRLPQSPGVALGVVGALLLVLGAMTYKHSGNFIDNYALFKHTYENNPKSWAAAHNVAFEYVKQAEEARGVIRQATVAGETVLAGQAEAEFREKLANARRLANETLALKPDHDWAHFTLGRIALMEGNRDEALAFFRKSAEVREDGRGDRDGPYAPTFVFIGDILRGKGDLEGASRNYKRAIALENPPFQPRSGPTRLSLLKTEMLRLAQLRPAMRPATGPVEGLAGGLAGVTTAPTTMRVEPFPGATTRETADLFDLAREVTELLPQNDDAWLVSGEVMYKFGRRQDALAAYREAVAINARNVNALVAFGIVLGDVGDYYAARVAFEEALKLSPGRTDAKQGLAIAQELLRRAAPTTGPTTGPTAGPAAAPSAGPTTVPALP